MASRSLAAMPGTTTLEIQNREPEKRWRAA
jgi:hypothetical protein